MMVDFLLGDDDFFCFNEECGEGLCEICPQKLSQSSDKYCSDHQSSCRALCCENRGNLI